MQNDQISQSVDNLISQTPDDDGDITTPTFSLGANPQQSLGGNGSFSNPPVQPTIQSIGVSSNQTDAPSDNRTSFNASNDSIGTANDPINDDLQQIKQQALSQLSPIVDELDQPPEEKYRTLMMLIQASDDQTLIKSAYEVANKIEDKKARAEALLNIVNEINYFSGQNKQND